VKKTTKKKQQENKKSNPTSTAMKVEKFVHFNHTDIIGFDRADVQWQVSH
jgi:hypothetical protein